MRLLALPLLALVTTAPLGAHAASLVPPAAHRATYELTMESNKGDINDARGSMSYEVTDACDGWATRQRLTLNITNREGQDIQTVSDYATWESKDGLSMRFRMRQTTDGAMTDQAEGTAKLDRAGGPGAIHYVLPEDKSMPLPAGTVFPMAHTEAILAAAEAGKKFVTLPLFDGTGDKGAQDSSIFITGWDAKGGAAPYPPLANMPNGKVRIAFFDRVAGGAASKPDGTPDYEVAMKYWANGVADDMHMDFSDFVMKGALKEFRLEPPHC
jgi:hypothetical protein